MLKGDHRGPTYATAGSSPLRAGVTGTQRLPSPRRPSPCLIRTCPGLSPGHVLNSAAWENHRVGYTIFPAAELDWHPRREGDPRLVAELSGALTQSRANLFRYPPGPSADGTSTRSQEEVFVVLDGTLTIHMGEDGAVEEHELATDGVLVVQPGTALQLSNRHEGELRLFIVGAPPERGEAAFLDPV